MWNQGSPVQAGEAVPPSLIPNCIQVLPHRLQMRIWGEKKPGSVDCQGLAKFATEAVIDQDLIVGGDDGVPGVALGECGGRRSVWQVDRLR